MKRTQIASLLARALAACAARNVSTADAPEMPAANVKVQSRLEAAASVRVIVRCDTFGPAHALSGLGVFVDGRHVANIGSGETPAIHLRPGRHVFGVGLRFNNAVPEREVAVAISVQDQWVLRAGPVAAGWAGWKITGASYGFSVPGPAYPIR